MQWHPYDTALAQRSCPVDALVAQQVGIESLDRRPIEASDTDATEGREDVVVHLSAVTLRGNRLDAHLCQRKPTGEDVVAVGHHTDPSSHRDVTAAVLRQPFLQRP